VKEKESGKKGKDGPLGSSEEEMGKERKGKERK